MEKQKQRRKVIRVIGISEDYYNRLRRMAERESRKIGTQAEIVIERGLKLMGESK